MQSAFTGSSGSDIAGKVKFVSPPLGFHSEGITPSGTNTVMKFSGAAARAGRGRNKNGSCSTAPLAMARPRKRAPAGRALRRAIRARALRGAHWPAPARTANERCFSTSMNSCWMLPPLLANASCSFLIAQPSLPAALAPAGVPVQLPGETGLGVGAGGDQRAQLDRPVEG